MSTQPTTTLENYWQVYGAVYLEHASNTNLPAAYHYGHYFTGQITGAFKSRAMRAASTARGRGTRRPRAVVGGRGCLKQRGQVHLALARQIAVPMAASPSCRRNARLEPAQTGWRVGERPHARGTPRVPPARECGG